MDVVIQKAENPSHQPTQVKKKRRVSGVSCTVYKPFEEHVASLNLPSTLSPLFEELDPKARFLRIWPDKDEDIPLVETKFGLVPRGSVFSYQQQQTSKRSSENLTQYQILTCLIWATNQLSLQRKSCCILIPLKCLWIKPLNMNE